MVSIHGYFELEESMGAQFVRPDMTQSCTWAVPAQHMRQDQAAHDQEQHQAEANERATA